MFSKLLLSAIMVFSVFVTFAVSGSTLNPEMTALVESYLEQAQKDDPSFGAFSAEDGKRLFFSERLHSKEKEMRGCTTCHTSDPRKSGKTPVGKVIEPIAPSVNKERFTDPKHVEKWFKRNCKWVLERECTPAEKGNYIDFMLTQ